MIETFDIAVLGAGPAGMAAATMAANAGARTIVLDENRHPGGQVYRLPLTGAAGQGEGDVLRSALAASGALVRSGTRVWGLGGGPLSETGASAAPFRIDGLRDGAVESIEARALIICAGTHETIVPFAGWTLPGIIGLGAATILLKADHVLPGQRVVVAGTGPLLAAVAAGILRHGGRVEAIVDAAPRRDWLRQLPRFAGHASMLAQGTGWLARIMAARTPILSGHRIDRAHGETAVTGVDIVPIAGGASRHVACDAVCVGHGLTPATEATRLYRATHDYVAARGGWIPRLDEWQRTTVPRLYAAGDGAGIAGASAAAQTGRIAALAALQDLGRESPSRATALATAPRRRLARLARFTGAIAAVTAPPEALFAAIPRDCVVCRCEDVTRAEIEAASQAGAGDLNQLKQFTRCGMGPCQGRFCAISAAALLSPGQRGALAGFTPRIPLRPVPLSAVLGAFRYADIPIPAPAPI